jgi:3-methyladenine DNA glycosylase AlkD
MTARKYFEPLEFAFKSNANPEEAVFMKKYMRNQFEYFGIKSQKREELFKIFLKGHGLPELENFDAYIRYLWKKPERDFQYVGMFIVDKSIKEADKNIIVLLEFMITEKSWWDTVDYIAARPVGNYFIKFTEQIKPVTERWVTSGYLWLQRSALLFQLKYKKNTDEGLLYNYIERLADHKDFFIRKAIGWTLREYSKTNPKSVEKFIKSHTLSALSVKEGMKRILK